MTRLILRLSCMTIVCVCVVGLSFVCWFDQQKFRPWDHLEQVERYEANSEGRLGQQLLGESLAILGRDHEVPSLQTEQWQGKVDDSLTIEELGFQAIPWRDAITEIAADHSIVMVMENHLSSKQRAMIRGCLPLFSDAGFTHYAAEGIGESSRALRHRGYPTFRTGYYTADPQFGNLIRRALELDFKVQGYDFRPWRHEQRERFAASQLAAIFARDGNAKLLVHAGHAHVLKNETEYGQRWLASYFWEETGIEPFTIWQWSERMDPNEYQIVSQAISKQGDFAEPILLVPRTAPHPQLGTVPAVDAILVHPPDQSVAPSSRTPLFSDGEKRLSGIYASEQWPVVIAAYSAGESRSAVPLDQVMLRPGESHFTLWVPEDSRAEILAYDETGFRSIRRTTSPKGIRIELIE